MWTRHPLPNKWRRNDSRVLESNKKKKKKNAAAELFQGDGAPGKSENQAINIPRSHPINCLSHCRASSIGVNVVYSWLVRQKVDESLLERWFVVWDATARIVKWGITKCYLHRSSLCDTREGNHHVDQPAFRTKLSSKGVWLHSCPLLSKRAHFFFRY